MHIDLYSTVQYYHIHAAVKFHRVTVIVIKIHGLMYSVVAGFRLSAALMVPLRGLYNKLRHVTESIAQAYTTFTTHMHTV